MAGNEECGHCGATLTDKRAKYCSAACKQASYRQRNTQPGAWRTAPARAIETKQQQLIEFTCAHCGETRYRTGLQVGTLYCSDKCKMKAFRKRKKDRARPLAEKIQIASASHVTSGKLINFNDLGGVTDPIEAKAWSDSVQKRLKPR